MVIAEGPERDGSPEHRGPRARPGPGRVAVIASFLAVVLLFSSSIAAPVLLPGASSSSWTGTHSLTGPPPASDGPGGTSHFSFPLGFVAPPTSKWSPSSTSQAPHPVMPGPLRATYGVDALLNQTGSPHFPVNETLGVIGWGLGYQPSDLATFFSTYYPSNFPPPKIIPVEVDGATPPGDQSASDPSGGSREMTIDIEWAASMAPGATIYAIYGPYVDNGGTYGVSDQTIEDALNVAVAMGNLTAVTMSFAEPQGSDPSVESALTADFANLTAHGTTLLAASGDDGGDATTVEGPACTTSPNVDFPAASPYVVAVGGTNVTTDPTSAWDLSGGGVSLSAASDPAPSWQYLGSAGGLAAQHGARDVPDVAASAALDEFYFSSELATPLYGTSFAAPTWAGIVLDMASADHARFGALDPQIYAVAAATEVLGGSPFTSVAQGGNCVASAAPGWNAVTGWGSPNASALAEDLKGSSTAPLNLTVKPTAGATAGQSVVLTVTNPPTGSSRLTGRNFTLALLNPDDDLPALRVNGTVPAPGAPSWSGSFTMPSDLGGLGLNLTVVATNGTLTGVGSVYLYPAIPPPPPGPSVWELLLTYQLPILGGFLVLVLFFRFYGGRRTSPAGPPPTELGGAAPLASSSATAGRRPGGSPPAPATGTSSAEMVPFCWKCGATLTGRETQCPSCGTRFSPAK